MEITVTDNGTDPHGFVWVIGKGSADEYKKIRRMIAAHSRKHNYGRWISEGCSFTAGTVEIRVMYHAGN